MRLARILLISAASLVCATAALAQDVDVMQYADTNGDGKVTTQEYTAFLGSAWDYLAQGAEKVKAADADPMVKGLIAGVTPDADGNVTKATLIAAAPAKFKAADKNGDGVLDAAELNASMRGD
jgi:Ca2+-binding EF-hand superfamily protein